MDWRAEVNIAHMSIYRQRCRKETPEYTRLQTLKGCGNSGLQVQKARLHAAVSRACNIRRHFITIY